MSSNQVSGLIVGHLMLFAGVALVVWGVSGPIGLLGVFKKAAFWGVLLAGLGFCTVRGTLRVPQAQGHPAANAAASTPPAQG